MKRFVKSLCCAVLTAATLTFSACSQGTGKSEEQSEPSQPESSQAGIEIQPAPSEWKELDQHEITAEMGMGWNLGNQLEASTGGVPSETVWGNPVITEQLILSIKEQGFSTVRIPVSYLNKIGEAPDYTIDEAWLNRVQEVVDYVVNNDLYAIINMHGDGYYTVDKSWLLCVEDDEKQTEIKAKYEAVWTQIADRFKDYDEHLIFESMNEEFDNTYGRPKSKGYENINAYNQIFVNAVRKTGSNNTKRWLLMPGWNTNIEYTAGNYGFVIPEDDLCEAEGNRLMISVHYYDPYNFTLDENMSTAKTQWGKYAVENFDDWGQEDYADSTLKKLNDVFVSKGYPVVIGEMGVQNKQHISDTFTGFRCYWMEYIVKAAKDNGCVPVYWDNGYNGDKGFGIIDRKTYEITQPELIAAMMRAINSDGDYEITAPTGVKKEDGNMRNVTVLLGDYWHPRNSIEPMLEKLFPSESWNITISEDPSIILNGDAPDLLVSFKDVIENAQIPTPLWCDDNWTARLDDLIKNQGMGFMAVHCGIADIPKDHFITENILRAYFVTHPPQCEVSFEAAGENEITGNLQAFTFTHPDEHYQIEIMGDTEVIGYTTSQNGKQPALWRHQYGNGKVLGITPGHSYENLSQAEYLELLKNCAEWCCNN